MFERQERTAMILLVAVALVVIAGHLILAGMGKQPFAQPFTSSSSEGELVAVEGRIDQITPMRTGGHLSLMVDNISLFLPGNVAGDLILKKGDRVAAYGTVQIYRGKKEVVVNAPEDIRIIPLPLAT